MSAGQAMQPAERQNKGQDLRHVETGLLLKSKPAKPLEVCKNQGSTYPQSHMYVPAQQLSESERNSRNTHYKLLAKLIQRRSFHLFYFIIVGFVEQWREDSPSAN